MIVAKNSYDWKYPKYLEPDAPVFSYDGFYKLKSEETDLKTQRLYLTLVVFVALALIFFKLWPLWLQEASWYGLVASFLGFFVIGAVRLLLRAAFAHLGIELWLFPNFYRDFYVVKPHSSLWPLIQVKLRDDAFDPLSLIVRVASAGLIAYFVVDFYKDDKKMEDLREVSFAAKGLFDYSSEWVLGPTALS